MRDGRVVVVARALVLGARVNGAPLGRLVQLVYDDPSITLCYAFQIQRHRFQPYTYKLLAMMHETHRT